MSIPRLFSALFLCALGASCGGSPAVGDAGTTDDVTPALDASALADAALADAGRDAVSLGEAGVAETRYIEAVGTLTEAITSANCALMRRLTSDYDSYFPTMTNEAYRSVASTRFRPVVDYMSRKLCNQFEIEGNLDNYKRDALADSPAGSFLSGTPLLQAIVDRSSALDGLLAAANAERSAAGLNPIIVADYPNSIVGGPISTIVFVPGWPERPRLDQWIQVQRTINQMFFVSLEPRADGRYNSYVHGRDMSTRNGSTTVSNTVANGTCLQCHYSGRPIHMRALDDATQAARVAALVTHLQGYPAQSNHPEYNPFPSSPGIGTGGKLTLEEASTYAGRTLTTAELATLNRNTACDSCHNNTDQNALRPPFGETVDILMRNGIMPPGAGVTVESERTEAIRVMFAAYRVRMRRYFLGD